MSDDSQANDLDELRRLGASASVEPVDWETPPPELWARIAEAAFGDDAVGTGSNTVEGSGDLEGDGDLDGDERAGVEVESRSPAQTSAPVVPITDTRRSAAGRWLLAAAAAVIVVGVGAVVWMRPSTDSAVVASVDLERLGDTGAGSAELIDDDGSLRLRLVADDIDAPDGFTEVWLINTDLDELVSLGPIRDDETYELPPGLDPVAFPIVDISFEPLDGNPEHSGDSVLRGQLTF